MTLRCSAEDLGCSHTKQWLASGEVGIPTPKPELHPKKLMLCSLVEHERIVPLGVSTKEYYCYC